ncbi:hypothetical protein N431DRAFT_557113 [Stipitochalara longipes BDJ]|nr:hypothetical protein N431DRAFT_557113 [Stipitochalara longipes BDJ]
MMSNHKKTWIIVRGCQYQPGGTISLGQLLVKPFEPSLPLLPDGPLLLPTATVERTRQTSVEISSLNSLGGSFQAWTSIDKLPVKSDLVAKHHTSASVTWKFDQLDCEVMVPRLADVQSAINRDEVIAQINRKRLDFRRRLYMITGVRVARGARLQQQNEKASSGGAKVGVSLAGLTALPVKFGPGANLSRAASDNYSFETASDFVFAYRVCEIHYGKDVYAKPYNKGETFGMGADVEASYRGMEVSSEGEQRIVVEKIANEEYSGSSVGHQSLKQDGSEYHVDDFILADEY